MSFDARIAKAPWAQDLFALMRRMEAVNADRPRIGDSVTAREIYLQLGQAPHLHFPASNIHSYRPAGQGAPARALVHFFGMLGPMGPLPLSTTEEALRWFNDRDDAFARFLDVFNHRFIELFYRAFADARPAEQAARPAEDRFADYVGSAIGIGRPVFRGLDSLPDFEKLRFAGLLAPRTPSAPRIEGLVAGIFGQRAEVIEFVGETLEIPAEERTRLGSADAGLGTGALLGARVISVDHKFRLRLFTDTLAVYENFLPDGAWHRRLADTLANAVGLEYAWDVELVLPAAALRPVCLGRYGRLGWTGWMRRPGGDGAVSARFAPAA